MKGLLQVTCLALLAASGSGCRRHRAQARAVDTGGSFALGGSCAYSVTSRLGATPPRLGPGARGGDGKVGKNPAPWALHLGYAADPSTSIVVSWRTRDDDTEAGVLELGDGESPPRRSLALYTDYSDENHHVVRVHEAHLCGLRPDTTYAYRVGAGPAHPQAWSTMYSFRTAPQRGNTQAPVTIVVVGDTRGGMAEWEKLVTKIDAVARPDLILFSGDAILDGHVQAEWDEWFEAARAVLPRVPILTAMGNHEDNAVNYYTQFSLPGDEESYGLDYGALHLTVLNDTPSNPADIAGKEAAFLDADLSASAAAPFHVVMHHKPLYSADAGHGDDPLLQGAWGPIYDKHHVDLVASGHSHGYQRTKPIRAGKVQATPGEGTVYLVAGGGGAPLYYTYPSDKNAFGASVYHFVVIQVVEGSLSLKAYSDEGTVFDTLQLAK